MIPSHGLSAQIHRRRRRCEANRKRHGACPRGALRQGAFTAAPVPRENARAMPRRKKIADVAIPT
eukprot:8523072-Pyramimonas_sp.AAC.1